MQGRTEKGDVTSRTHFTTTATDRRGPVPNLQAESGRSCSPPYGDPRSFSIAAAADATLWLTTTGIAMIFILKGKVPEHRQWMTRTFAVSLGFLERRGIRGLSS